MELCRLTIVVRNGSMVAITVLNSFCVYEEISEQAITLEEQWMDNTGETLPDGSKSTPMNSSWK
jgi:hypothetical protein